MALVHSVLSHWYAWVAMAAAWGKVSPSWGGAAVATAFLAFAGWRGELPTLPYHSPVSTAVLCACVCVLVIALQQETARGSVLTDPE